MAINRHFRIEKLFDHPEVIPIFKEWFETEWEAYYGLNGTGDAQKDLNPYANWGELPIGVIAFLGDKLCGTSTTNRLFERHRWKLMEQVRYNGEDLSIYQKEL